MRFRIGDRVNVNANSPICKGRCGIIRSIYLGGDFQYPYEVHFKGGDSGNFSSMELSLAMSKATLAIRHYVSREIGDGA